ncbi:MAG: hypothetical protein AAGA56_28640, partial [Myxococcota bacterium]
CHESSHDSEQTGRASLALGGDAPTARRWGSVENGTTLAVGERVGLSGLAVDLDDDLAAVDWYHNGNYLGRQRYSNAERTSTDERLFWRGINFSGVGPQIIEMEPYDENGNYGPPVRWDLRVQARPRALYISYLRELFENPGALERLMNFAQRHGFSHAILYETHLFIDSYFEDDLGDLVASLRSRFSQVWAAVGSDGGVRRVADYSRGTGSAARRFDGIVSEYEFWNGQRWDGYRDLMAEAVAQKADLDWTVATYVGGLESWQADHIVAVADLVMLAGYRTNPGAVYGAIESMMRHLADDTWSRAPQVWALTSAEDGPDATERCIETSTNFMGDHLFAARFDADPVGDIEARVMSDFRSDGGRWRNGVRLSGFAMFQYPLIVDDLDPSISSAARADGKPWACRICDGSSGGCSPRYDRLATIHVNRGEGYTFRVDAGDEGGNLASSEWFGFDDQDVRYLSAGDPGRQVVGAASGSTFARRYVFYTRGEYTISMNAVDTTGHRSETLRWDVVVH